MSLAPGLPSGPEVPLLGGDVTEGVVRIADTVRRPRGPHSPVVEVVLSHLERVGFTGAPRFLGVDVQGRDALTYVDGEVAARPWPQWVADEERIVSVARLVRAYDDAVAPLGLPPEALAVQTPDPPGTPPLVTGPATLLGHMDVTPENVVFVDGRAAALIDFDLVRPTTRLREVCNVLLWWAPLMPADDREPALRDVDPFTRARLLVDAYGLGPADRSRVVECARNTAARSWFLMRDHAERLGGGWHRMWAAGVGDRIERRQAWLAEHAQRLHDAVT